MSKSDDTSPKANRNLSSDSPATGSGDPAITDLLIEAESFLTVGIGASAGGLEAFQTFFQHMDNDSGMAFVLISHLSPDHESMLSELLAKETQMPVLQVQNETLVEPNQVYVIPPNANLTIEDGVLKLSQPFQTRGHRSPINVFFQSLAEDQKENAICIVLSGTGSDGTLGLKSVKEHGGLAIAQDSETAKYDSMPRSAALTGLVDYVLPVDQIPAKLIEYARHWEGLRESLGEDGIFAATASNLNQICNLLRQRVGHDFTGYKENTLIRRIQRRIQITQHQSVDAYVRYLRSDGNEINLLFKDLLIGITHFFRDPDSFQALQSQVISPLVKNKEAGTTIRIWVPGCSSGEEVYSIAILLAEEMERQSCYAEAQIFATDIDEKALNVARQASYPENIAEQIFPERLDRFFVRKNGTFQVSKHLREMCIFSQHSLIGDPPFSNLHLISCRNLLIYLDNTLQRKVIPLFHYALQARGFLYLGSSENLTGHSELFKTVDKQHRIFQKKQTMVPPAVDFPLIESSLYRKSTSVGLSLPPATQQQHINRIIERVLLQDYAPACVIINDQNDVVYFFGRTGKYLEPSQGLPSTNLFDMARRGLRLDLRAGIQVVRETRRPAVREQVSVESDNQVQLITLTVRPIQENDDGSLLMVIFKDEGVAPIYDQVGTLGDESDGESQVVQQLEKELRTTKEHLRSTIEELETSNEELKSANEELLSMNEELQSSNEELQTSKEEMQSMNEELETVNAELRHKIDELDSANSDLQNLFESTQIATIFLNQSLRIKKFTPAATHIFNFIETDVGRPITDIASAFSEIDIAADVRQVLISLVPVEREVKMEDRLTCYKMRVLPYRTIDNVIDGAVITFVDVSDLRQTRQHAELSARRQQAIAELGIYALQHMDVHSICDRAVEIACQTLESDRCSLFVKDSENAEQLVMKAGRGWDSNTDNMPHLRADNSLPGYTLSVSASVLVEDFAQENRFVASHFIRDLNLVSGVTAIVYGSGNPYGVLAIYGDDPGQFTAEDASFLQSIANALSAALQREQTTQALSQSRERLNLALDAGYMGVWEYNPNSGFSAWNSTEYQLLGLPPETTHNPNTELFFSYVHPEDINTVRQSFETAMAQRTPYSAEFRIIRANGEVRWLVAQAKTIIDDTGNLEKVIGVNYDITERKQNEAALKEADRHKDEFLAMLGHELRNPLNVISNSLVLMQGIKGREEFDRMHAIATRQLTQFTRLIDDLFDVSRIAYRKIRIQPEPTCLNVLLQYLRDDNQDIWQAQKLNVSLHLPDPPVWVNGDPVRLTQAFTNILRNAIKFSFEGGTIDITARRISQQVRVTITDTGIGLDPEALSRIFRAFRQENLSPVPSAGLGLGLALAKGIVELHGGTIQAHSAGLDQGTEILVELPQLDTEATPAPQSSRVSPPSQANLADENGSIRVLIVEDNEDAIYVLETFLESIGCQVEVAVTGIEGVDKAQNFQPDIVISDINLPEMDGYQFAQVIRSDSALSPVCLIAVSGYGQPKDKAQALDAGFDYHMTKPIKFDELRNLIFAHFRKGSNTQ